VSAVNQFKMAFSKETIFDALMNFVLISPLTLMFVVGTKLIIEEAITSRIGNPLHAALVLLTVGVSIEFIVSYWQVS
jgi:hypothetical protein